MAIDIDALKEIAKSRVEKGVGNQEELTEFIKIWWSRRYNLPDNHPLFLNKRLEEHVIDYFVNDFMDNPEKLKEMTIEEQEAYEEELKKKMGDSYKEEYDYLIPPDATQEEKTKLNALYPDEEEETF